jgi:hypothetical protein
VHVQRLVSVITMGTVFERCTTEKQSSFVRFLWSKGLNAKAVHKEMSPAYEEKWLSRKAALKWEEILSRMLEGSR